MKRLAGHDLSRRAALAGKIVAHAFVLAGAEVDKRTYSEGLRVPVIDSCHEVGKVNAR